MILWTFKNRPETRGDDMPNKAFRWALKLERWCFGLAHECQDRKTGEWEDSHTDRYDISLERRWMWGSHHFYYDGPHCMFALGPIRIQWAPLDGHCAKCMPD